MLTLAAVTGVSNYPAYPAELTAAAVMTIDEYDMIPTRAGNLEYYDSLLPGLRANDRDDLADALDSVLSATRARR